jgi:hypothetical protein
MSKHPSTIRERYLRRVGVRPPAPRIMIVCDDTRTAPNYFAALRGHLSGHHSSPPILDVKGACHHGAATDELIDFAAGLAKGLGEDDSIWVLIDLEASETEPRSVSALRKQSRNRKSIKPAVSKPCFEVWTLHHLADTGQKFRDCAEVNGELRKVWKKKFGCDFGNKKAKADYAKIVGRYEDATERSRRQKNHGHCHSEIYLVIEEINRYLVNKPEGAGGQD